MGVPGITGYVHEVRMLGRIEKRDVNWIGFLQRRFRSATTEAYENEFHELSNSEIARNYWLGNPSTGPNWEFVAETAVIVNADNLPSRIPEMRDWR